MRKNETIHRIIEMMQPVVVQQNELEKALKTGIHQKEHPYFAVNEMKGATTVGHWEYDLRTGRIKASKVAQQILGLKNDNKFITLREIESHIPQVKRHEWIKFVYHTIKGKEFSYCFSIQPNNNHGHKRISIYTWFVEDDLGPAKLTGVLIDITMEEKNLLELEKSEHRFFQFFHDDLTGDFMAKPDGSLITCNLSYARIFGYSTIEEVVAVNQNRFFISPETHDDFVRLIEKKKKLLQHETKKHDRFGKEIYLQENIIGEFNASGELIGYKGYLINITKQKEYE
ncbi:MAG: PAS domain S-box protein [Bacteroidales bacterium]|nr:PAS domain S-box protein [Bacteroidales bacterium]